MKSLDKEMYKLIVTAFLSLVLMGSHAQGDRRLIDFRFEQIKLSGILDLPKDKEPKGIVLIIHGDGKTNAIQEKWWYDVRSSILEAGFATYMWDKMGCGNSEGTYQNGRPIENEALEVIAAINHLKRNKIEGSDTIGLWGISRAGWICPVVIDQYQNINFWISVSGVDDDETFKYLLEQNLRINGNAEKTIELIVSEWHNSILLSRSGANYQSYLTATNNLRNNAFWKRITNGGVTEKQYYQYQEILQTTPLDKESNLPQYVEDFEQILSRIEIPILALFGEKDMTVNWRKTKILYEETLTNASKLTIETFPNCNHNMWQATTGAIFESEDPDWKYVRCDGFLESITTWLTEVDH